MNKGRIFQAVVLFAIMPLFFFPIYRSYTNRNSIEAVPRHALFGLWTQSGKIENIYMGNDPPIAPFPYILFNENGSYLINADYSNGGFNKATGNWFYYSEKHHFLNLINFGYRNWVQLNSNNQAGVQFYLRKNNQITTMHSGDNLSSLSGKVFRKVNHNGGVHDTGTLK